MCYKENLSKLHKILAQKNIEDLQDSLHAKKLGHMVIFSALPSSPKTSQ